jgi:hypothetical protein
LVNSIEGIFWTLLEARIAERWHGTFCTYLYQLTAAALSVIACILLYCLPYLGENVVREKEYLSAILGPFSDYVVG